MHWTNLLSEKKLFFKQLDRESKLFYLRKNFKKFNLVFKKDLPLKKNFIKLCDYMQWADLYNLFYELFIELINYDLDKEKNDNLVKAAEEKINIDHNDQNKNNDKVNNEIKDINEIEDNEKTKIKGKKKIKTELRDEFFKILNQDLEKMESEISATAEENKRITKTVSLLQEFIKSYFPHCIIDPFGSFMQGLHLRDSDIDVVVFDKAVQDLLKEIGHSKAKKPDYGFNSPDKKLLGVIKKKLLRTNFASFNDTQFINAKVPIIKTKCKKTGVNIDIR